MGQSKALLPWDGETLITYQVRQLAMAGIHPIVVVLGHRAAEVGAALQNCPETTMVENRRYTEGKTTSIRAGAEALTAEVDAVLIQAADQPRSAETIAQLISDHFEAHALISIPVYQGKWGHPPVFSITLRQELLNLSEEQQGLREVILRHREAIVEVPFSTPEVLWNLNTPDQYQQALENKRTTNTHR